MSNFINRKTRERSARASISGTGSSCVKGFEMRKNGGRSHISSVRYGGVVAEIVRDRPMMSVEDVLVSDQVRHLYSISTLGADDHGSYF